MQASTPSTGIRRGVAERGLKPAQPLASGRPHGDRLRYLAGCRCDACRAANAAYERQRIAARRAGEWNGLVPADRARAHILALARRGIGRRAVAAASDVASSLVFDIRTGRRARIRANTERRILAVTPGIAADHALTDARQTWRLIRELLGAGFTKARIARELGQIGHGLQLGRKQVTVRNAERVRRLHRQLMASREALVAAGPTWRLIKRLREECYSDKQIARALDVDVAVLVTRNPRIQRHLEERVIEVYRRMMT